MLLSAITVEGLRHAEVVELRDLDNRVLLPAGPAGVAAADGLELLAAALHRDRLLATLIRLGLAETPEQIDLWEEDGVPVQAAWPDPAGTTAWIDAGATRRVVVGAQIALDPPLFGRLRELSVREPRLVDALGDEPVVTVKVGALFTTDLRAVSLSLLRVAVGSVAFPTQPNERPGWILPLLRDLTARIARPDPNRTGSAVAEALLDASLAHDPQRRASWERLRRIAGEAPFGLGELGLVRQGGKVSVRFGDQLIPSRAFGPAGDEVLRLLEATLLDRPDVLVVDAPGAQLGRPQVVVDWLVACTNGDDAVLEQVVVVPGGTA